MLRDVVVKHYQAIWRPGSVSDRNDIVRARMCEVSTHMNTNNIKWLLYWLSI